MARKKSSVRSIRSNSRCQVFPRGRFNPPQVVHLGVTGGVTKVVGFKDKKGAINYFNRVCKWRRR